MVHLVGVSHPNPKKAAEFRGIDLKSCREAVAAASKARAQHFVYLSVARPAPVMQEYQAVRAEGEALIAKSGLRATFDSGTFGVSSTLPFTSNFQP